MSDQLTYGALSASGDLNDVQYRFVEITGTNEKVQQATGASNPYPLGILQNDPKDGEACNVCVAGVSLVYVDAAASQIVVGMPVTCGSTGLAVPGAAVSGSAPIVGMIVADATSSGSGVLSKVLVLPMGVKVGAS